MQSDLAYPYFHRTDDQEGYKDNQRLHRHKGTGVGSTWPMWRLNTWTVVESQCVSMMLHSQWIGETVNKIRVTGGASSSDGICQIIADVFQCPVERINTTDSAALGGAMRATQAAGYNLSKVVRKFTEASDVIHPRKEYADVYEALLEKYAASEAERLI